MIDLAEKSAQNADGRWIPPLREDWLALEKRLRARYASRELTRLVVSKMLGFASPTTFQNHIAESLKHKLTDGPGMATCRARVAAMTAILDDRAPLPRGITLRRLSDADAWLRYWRAAGLATERPRRNKATGKKAAEVAPAPAPLPAPVELPPPPVVSKALPLLPAGAQLSLGAAADRAAAEAADVQGDYRRKFLAGQAQGNRLAKETLDALEVARDNARDNTGRVLEALERIEGLLGRLLAVWEPQS